MGVEPLRLRNPVVLAAGILGDTPENLRAAYDAGAGAVVTKSLTLDARDGNPEPTVLREGSGWLNSVGLRNPGAKRFASMLGDPDYPVIVSLAGFTPGEFTEMAGLFGAVAAFELNVSCPNAGGYYTGQDPRLTGDIVAAVKSCTDLPVFVKVGINMDGAVKAAMDAGVDGITAINAVPAMRLDPATGRPAFHNVRCGLSGPPIRAIALNEVYRMARVHGIPVMGCGGVCNAEDALSLVRAGAWAVQVGSAAMMDGIGILGEIAAGLSRRRVLASPDQPNTVYNGTLRTFGMQKESVRPTTKKPHYGFRLAEVEDDRARRAYDMWNTKKFSRRA